MKANQFVIFAISIVAIAMMVACTSKKEMSNEEPQGLYRIQVGGKFGFIDDKGNIVIEPQFDRAYWQFQDGVCYAEVDERKYLINNSGELAVELDTNISWVYRMFNGTAIARSTQGKYGIISKDGETLLPLIYKNIKCPENNGYILEDTLGNMGYANKDGKIIIPCQYDDVHDYYDGLAVVATRDKCGYMDTLGEWAIEPIYDDARDFCDGMARVKIGTKWRFIDNKGNEMNNLKYGDILTGFSCGRAFVKQWYDILMIDKEGRKIATIQADSVWSFHDGYATYRTGGKYGKIDTLGNVVIKPSFERLYGTVRGLSVFEKNGKQGVIDSAGNVIIDAIHENITNDKSRLLILGTDNNWKRGSWYDRQGNLIWKDANQVTFPDEPTKEDWITLFNSRMSELDPIEGVYYVTYQSIRENMETGHVTPAGGTNTEWYALIKNIDEIYAYSITKPGNYWKKKFVKIGETNMYAITNIDSDDKYAEDGNLQLDNPSEFEINLRTSGNGTYNWYHHYEFVKEFPTSDIIEQVQKAEWTGSGFAIADGYIVTNNHVVSGAKRIFVRGINGDSKKGLKGAVVATDVKHDLAIIRIVDKVFKGFDEIPYTLGKSMPEVGDDVFVLGYPMTNTMGKDVKLTDGIISAASGYQGDLSMYQITAAVQPGNSGGPLFDSEGNVIGVVCAKHADAENANYAVKISYLYSLVNKSDLGIKLSNNKLKAKSLSKQVKQIKPFVYIIECNSR